MCGQVWMRLQVLGKAVKSLLAPLQNALRFECLWHRRRLPRLQAGHRHVRRCV